MNTTDDERPNLSDWLDCAETAARTAGRYALEQSARRREVLKTLSHDVKLQLDVESQAIAEDVIRKRFPHHAILGEESTTPLAEVGSTPLWIIDPIDGTVNFSHGLPLWCCSVAVQLNGISMAGAVFAPELDLCYTAHAEQASCCNGNPISVSNINQLDAAMISTGINNRIIDLGNTYDRFQRLSHHTQKVRIMGSAALDVCFVASGKVDGFFETGIYVWDIAAGDLLVRQAGGRTEIVRQLDNHRLVFLASNGLIHEPLKNLVIDTLE